MRSAPSLEGCILKVTGLISPKHLQNGHSCIRLQERLCHKNSHGPTLNTSSYITAERENMERILARGFRETASNIVPI